MFYLCMQTSGKGAMHQYFKMKMKQQADFHVSGESVKTGAPASLSYRWFMLSFVCLWHVLKM